MLTESWEFRFDMMCKLFRIRGGIILPFYFRWRWSYVRVVSIAIDYSVELVDVVADEATTKDAD